MILELQDKRCVEAAEGWLGLGNWREAIAELDQIPPQMQEHPLVLRARWGIQGASGKWESAVDTARAIAKKLPDDSWGWIHWAYSLHELKRTKEAQSVLRPIADQFPNESTIQYNMACYCCQLGQAEESRQWLERAMALEGKKHIRAMALEDPDLEPLWKEIAGI
jgi:predicted Zn-dependent protease